MKRRRPKKDRRGRVHCLGCLCEIESRIADLEDILEALADGPQFDIGDLRQSVDQLATMLEQSLANNRSKR